MVPTCCRHGKIDVMKERVGPCRNNHSGQHSYWQVNANRPGGGMWVCRSCKGAKSIEWRKESARRRDEAHQRLKENTVASKRRSRQAALALLGGRCTCCWQSRPVFLQFDHINDDGAAYRRSLGYNSGQATWRWVLANPAVAHLSIQILCANCNMAKAIEKDHHCPPEA